VSSRAHDIHSPVFRERKKEITKQRTMERGGWERIKKDLPFHTGQHSTCQPEVEKEPREKASETYQAQKKWRNIPWAKKKRNREVIWETTPLGEGSQGGKE